MYAYLCSLIAVARAGDVEAIALTQAPGFTSLRGCAKYCFEGIDIAPGIVIEALSCSVNACFCRPDLLSDAHSAISSCIYTDKCHTTNAVDLSIGVSFYDGYCSSYRAALAGSVSATVTDASSPTTSSSRTTVTITTTSTPNSAGSNFSTTSASSLSSLATFISTSSSSTSISSTSSLPSSNPSNTSSNNTTSTKGLSKSDIITIIFGVLGAVVAISVGVWQGRGDSITRRMVREWRGHERDANYISQR